MNRRLSNMLPFLCAGVIAGTVAAIICNPVVFWAMSGYSRKSFLLMFADEPSEADLLDVMIQREPLIKDKSDAVLQWRLSQADGYRLAIKMDSDQTVVVSPYSADREADTVFADGGRIRGVWLTEPGTRIQFPSMLVRSASFLVGLSCGVIALLVVRWLWFFFLARTRELSAAVRGH